MPGKIKVLVLTTPPLIPEMKEYLSKDADIEVALLTYEPDAIVSRLSGSKASGADAVLLDYVTPVTGEDFIQRITPFKIPIIIIANSVQEGFAYLNRGANDMIVRRTAGEETVAFFYRMVSVHIVDTVKKFGEDKNRARKIAAGKISGKVIAIASSTGGTETVLEILKDMPPDAPPILIVQHMPPVFTKLYADRANSLCKINVWEAKHGDVLANGLALIAPGGRHMVLCKRSGLLQVELNDSPPVWSQRPSADVLFKSVAATAMSEAVGVILTGMGEDGADGLLAMRKRGAYTIGQDQETSIVYGMPKAAYECGAVTIQLPLSKIAREILDNVGGS